MTGPTSPAAGASGPMPEQPSLVGQILDGRYRITRKLGEGGMGEVYAAEHVHIEKRFAIKLLRQEIASNKEAVERFRQEARSSSSIGHRNIIATEDFGALADGRIYMAMELLNGAALNDLITTPQPVDRLLNILIQTGHGLAAAHAKGITHRDMKPENIFVSVGPNQEDVPKILDFGIAKVVGNDSNNNLTKTGTIFGTPFYMAPEQALGNTVDARTDVYAMGVIMYEVFAGSLPFQGESFMGILTQHITTEPEPVAQRAAKAGRSLPPGLADVITRCMQKNPAQRFQTMDELVNALITIYRGIAGPGMSTYMEAFPVNPTAARPAVPTPGPMTAQGVAQGLGVGPHAPSGPMPGPMGHMGPPPGTGPYAQQSYPMGGYDASSSALDAPKKSKAWLIVLILVLLAAGGAIAAVLVVGGDGEGDGAGSGSQVASGSDDGSGDGSGGDDGSNGTNGTHGTNGTSGDDGSAGTNGTNGTNGSNGTTVQDGSDGTPQDGSAGSAGDGSNDGSNAGSNDVGLGSGSDAGSGSNAETPEVPGVSVLLYLKNGGAFEVYEEGSKLFDGPGLITVKKGSPRKVSIRAKGYKERTVEVDGDKTKLAIRLDRDIVRPPPGCTATSCPAGQRCVSGKCKPKPVIQPPSLDCSKVAIDWHNAKCKKQYCDGHPDDTRCGLE